MGVKWKFQNFANRQQTIALFITTPASRPHIDPAFRPLLPPVLPGSRPPVSLHILLGITLVNFKDKSQMESGTSKLIIESKESFPFEHCGIEKSDLVDSLIFQP